MTSLKIGRVVWDVFPPRPFMDADEVVSVLNRRWSPYLADPGTSLDMSCLDRIWEEFSSAVWHYLRSCVTHSPDYFDAPRTDPGLLNIGWDFLQYLDGLQKDVFSPIESFQCFSAVFACFRNILERWGFVSRQEFAMLTLWTGSLRWAFPLVQEFRATALGCEQIKELLALSAEREMVMALFGVGEGRKKTTDWEKYGNFPWDGCPQLSKARINAFLSRDATERLIIELRYLDRLFQDDERFPPSFSDVCLDPLMATWNAIPEHVYKNYAATEWLPRLENIRSRFSFAEGNHESQAEHD